MTTLMKETVGSLVAKDYKASAVFAKYKIDFCCKGGRTLEEACQSKNLDPAAVEREVKTVFEQSQPGSMDYHHWPLDLLADYIEKKHHRYINEKIPLLTAWLEKLCQVHGGRHPELHQIRQHFADSARELSSHMQKEELVLFPAVRRMVKAKMENRQQEKPTPLTISYPIQAMMAEHDTEGERFRTISELTNDYTPPADACTTYRVAFATLQEFEADLHLHIHLENNILFPKAIELEKQLI